VDAVGAAGDQLHFRGKERGVPIDPYSRANPIGPGATLASYKSGGNAVTRGLNYATLVLTQEALDVSGIDAGLAVLVSAHQAQLKRQATEFADTVAADFRTLIADAGNFADIFAAFDTLAARDRDDSGAAGREAARDQLMAIADYAGEVGSDGDTAVDHVTVLRTELGRIGKRLDAAVKRAVAAVGEDGAAAAKRIDDLTKKIADNIQAIVDGATETGDAVKDLGIGVLTMIVSGLGDKPAPPDDGDDTTGGDGDDTTGKGAGGDTTGDTTGKAAGGDTTGNGAGGDTTGDTTGKAAGGDTTGKAAGGASSSTSGAPGPGDGTVALGDVGDAGDSGTDGESDDGESDPGGSGDDDASTTNKSDGKVPDASFVVLAIKAGSKGTEKYAGAIAELTRNNDLLAREYQRLATANQLIAIAKATQAQQSLFAASATETAQAVTAIRGSWQEVRKALNALSDRTNDANLAEVDRLRQGALKQWKAVAADLAKLKAAMTRMDSLSVR
jgi:hypothetical protein